MNKWDVLDSSYHDALGQERKVFDPHSVQLMLAEDNARFQVTDAGRRMGKSYWIAHEFLPYAFLARKMASYLKSEGKRMEFWSVGPTYSDSEKPFRVFYNKCSALGMPFDKPGTYYSQESGSMTVSLWDGAFIYSAKSAQHPERLVGEGLWGAHLEEAAKLKEIVWQQMVMPTLGDFDGWAKFTSTPEGKNWFYRIGMNAKTSPNWSFHQIPAWVNPVVYKTKTITEHVRIMMRLYAENLGWTPFEIAKQQGLVIDESILQAANDLPIPVFQQEFAAEFTDFVGKVFKDFDEDVHSRPLSYNPSWETVAAVDYGYRNPNVWLLIQIGPWGEINVIDELYQENLTPTEFANEILRRGLCPDTCTEFYPDPASPGDTATMENIFRRAGKIVKAKPHTGGEINDRLNLIRLALRDKVTDHEKSKPLWVDKYPSVHERPRDLTRPRLLINSVRCVKTIYEMAEYRYPEIKDEQVETSRPGFEVPMKKDDHTPEALGRFFMGKYKSVQNQSGGGTKISKAAFVRGMRGRGQYADNDWGPEPAGLTHASNPQSHGTWR
jgi:hypothetical protein